jgi:hypothetical protein
MSVSWRRCLSRWWGFVPWRDGPGVFVGVHFAAILNQVVGLAYPVSDVVMVLVVAMAAHRERRHRMSLF